MDEKATAPTTAVNPWRIDKRNWPLSQVQAHDSRLPRERAPQPRVESEVLINLPLYVSLARLVLILTDHFSIPLREETLLEGGPSRLLFTEGRGEFIILRKTEVFHRNVLIFFILC